MKSTRYSPASLRLCGMSAMLLSIAACSSSGSESSGNSSPPDSVNRAPVISGNPPTSAPVDAEYTFTPDAFDPDGDGLVFSVENSPYWTIFDSGTGTLAGMPGTIDLGEYPNIRIAVSDGSLTDSLPAFSITVPAAVSGSAALAWTAPSQNTDGSPLTDLLEFRLYYGTEPGTYTSVVTTDSTTTEYTFNNLSSGTYYFVATAVSQTGGESEFSNAVSKVIN